MVLHLINLLVLAQGTAHLKLVNSKTHLVGPEELVPLLTKDRISVRTDEIAALVEREQIFISKYQWAG